VLSSGVLIVNYYQGRLIDHVHLHVTNLEASRQFYLAILTAMNKADSFEGDQYCFYCDELFVDGEAQPSKNIHIAFQADSKAMVQAFYQAVIAAGGPENGEPGHRNYHSAYYAAVVFDPDGNNIEAIFDEGASRFADAVVVVRPGADD